MKKYIKAALRYKGKHERRDRQELQNLMGVNPDRVAWCAYFVKAILDKCKVNGIRANGLARSFLKEGKAIELKNAQAGDIVVFKRGRLPWQGHVGFYLDHSRTKILVLGGNQSNAVTEAKYPKSDLLGVRRIR